MAIKTKHISELAERSRRLDIRLEAPSLIVFVPEIWRRADAVNEIARVDVNKHPVGYTLINRYTAQLSALPPEGSSISLYWVFPADHCSRLMAHLQDAETGEQLDARLAEQGKAYTDAAGRFERYGLQPPNYQRKFE